jgi:hypothetical protein
MLEVDSFSKTPQKHTTLEFSRAPLVQVFTDVHLADRNFGYFVTHNRANAHDAATGYVLYRPGSTEHEGPAWDQGFSTRLQRKREGA